jgi:hypothetical protein
LENVYRLDEVEARDAVCDNTLDKGVDGIYVDHNDQEVHFLQGKIRQATNGTIGDVGPKTLSRRFNSSIQERRSRQSSMGTQTLSSSRSSSGAAWPR